MRNFGELCANKLLLLLLWVFHTNVSWQSFTGVWVTASLQDSSQYSSWPQQCCSLESLHTSSNFQIFYLLHQSFGGSFQVHQLKLVSLSPSYSIALLVSLARSKYLSLFMFSLVFHSVIHWDGKVYYSAGFLSIFLSLGLVFWLTLGDLFYLKVTGNLMCLILQDRFWVVQIPFGRMVKFQFLAQFPVDHLLHPVVSTLILFLC